VLEGVARPAEVSDDSVFGRREGTRQLFLFEKKESKLKKFEK